MESERGKSSIEKLITKFFVTKLSSQIKMCHVVK